MALEICTKSHTIKEKFSIKKKHTAANLEWMFERPERTLSTANDLAEVGKSPFYMFSSPYLGLTSYSLSPFTSNAQVNKFQVFH